MRAFTEEDRRIVRALVSVLNLETFSVREQWNVLKRHVPFMGTENVLSYLRELKGECYEKV